MSIVEATRAASEPHGEALFGLELFHDVYLVLPSLASWSAVAEALNHAGAELQSVQLLRQGDAYSGRCRLKRVSAEEARGISVRLIETGVARQCSVEHLMLRQAAERTP